MKVGIGGWQRRYAAARKKERRVMDLELELRQKLSELGHIAQFTLGVKNKSGGPVDMIFNGVPLDIKTPQMFTTSALERRLNFKQGDNFMIHLQRPIKEIDRALSNLRNRLRGRPKAKIWVLRDYNKPYLEKVKWEK